MIQADNPILVSVVVPVYKIKEEYLRACVGSLLEQSLKEIEIILVDDGSPDRCGEICDKLAETDCRIRVIHQRNKGVSAARNRGMEQARGKYLSFVDADDWIDPDTLAEAYRNGNERQADIVFWCYQKEYANRSVPAVPYPQNGLIYHAGEGIEEFDPLFMGLLGSSWGKLYAADVIKGCRYDERLKNGEDVEFNFRVYRGLKKAVYLNRPFYHYRQLGNSAVRNYNPKMMEQYGLTLAAIESDLNENREERFIAAFHTFTGLCYLLLASQLVFVKENPAPFRDKRRQMREITDTEPYRSVIAGNQGIHLSIEKRVALFLARRHSFFGLYCLVQIKKILDKSEK